jgi:hypothetical protein
LGQAIWSDDIVYIFLILIYRWHLLRNK